jgi:hypothetical protein
MQKDWQNENRFNNFHCVQGSFQGVAEKQDYFILDIGISIAINAIIWWTILSSIG